MRKTPQATRVLYILLMALSLCGCNRSEKDRLTVGALPGASSATSLGTISLGMGGSIFSAPGKSPALAASSITKGSITLNAVEISQDGSQWFSVTSAPLTLTLTDNLGSYTDLNIDATNIPAGEYHAVRITLAENPTVISPPNLGNLNPFPNLFLFQIDGFIYQQGTGTTEKIIVSSRNGFLTPFNVTQGQTMFLVLGLRFRAYSGLNWSLIAGARATAIPPQ